MKSFSVLIAIAFSVLFFACEEETIPIPLPPPSPSAANEPAPALTPTPVPEPTPAPAPTPIEEKKAELPVKAEKPSEPVKIAKAPPPVKEKEPAKTVLYYGNDDIEQSNKGIFIVQVATSPTEASAKRIIKKLADDGIKAYNAKVENPDPDKGMFGTYHRVRVGFFDRRASAEAFAKARLEPLGYKWWVDKSRNDKVGKQTYSYSEPEPFVVERIPEQPQQEPRQMSEQEKREAERAAAIAAAKEEYKAIAKAAMANPAPAKAAAAPKAASPQTKAKVAEKFKKKEATKEAEIDSRGRVKMKNK